LISRQIKKVPGNYVREATGQESLPQNCYILNKISEHVNKS